MTVNCMSSYWRYSKWSVIHFSFKWSESWFLSKIKCSQWKNIILSSQVLSFSKHSGVLLIPDSPDIFLYSAAAPPVNSSRSCHFFFSEILQPKYWAYLKAPCRDTSFQSCLKSHVYIPGPVKVNYIFLLLMMWQRWGKDIVLYIMLRNKTILLAICACSRMCRFHSRYKSVEHFDLLQCDH